MTRSRRRSWGLLGLLVVSGCSPTPSLSAEAGVHLTCQPQRCPDGPVLIEIGSLAFEAEIADGTVLVPAETPVEVRILNPDSCEVFAEFSADLHSRYVVALTTARPPDIVDTTQAEEPIGFPMGPSMAVAAPSSCP